MTRPATAPGYSDILGQQRACSRLWSALSSDRLHHCYLFEGPPGVGKATVALRFAMAANCESVSTDLPCGRCRTCQLIATGRHPDVLEVAPEEDSTTGIITVDQARELLHKLQLHRHSARHRIVIIDPIDAMRAEAANAILKTLEEPPAGTGFILVSSRVGVLLPTVLSRSLRVRFHAVPVQDLAIWLAARGVASPALLARRAGGSPGQALILAEGRAEALDQALGALLEGIARDPKELFAYVEGLTTGGRPAWEAKVALCLESLEIMLRDCACHATGRSESLLLPRFEAPIARWSKALWPGGLRLMEHELEKARLRLHMNVTPRVVLEALLATLAAELGASRSPAA